MYMGLSANFLSPPSHRLSHVSLKSRELSCFDLFDGLEGESYGAAIWQIPELYGELNSPQLERITSLDAHVSKIKW